MLSNLDPWQLTFFGAAALLVLAKTWQGWQMGIGRQAVNILALVAAYVVGYFGGNSLVAPLHTLINAPERALAVMSAAIVGLVVYFGISIAGKILFKKTSQHTGGMTRFGYGASGAGLGAFYGIFLVWIAILTIRLLGSVAETRMAVGTTPPSGSGKSFPSNQAPPPPPSVMIQGLAHMKQSLEQGAAGSVVQQVDPIPGTLYGVLHKIGMIASDEHGWERFASFPGAKPLLANPKIAALQNDPEIMQEIVKGDYLGLMRNSRILAVANDSEIGELMKSFEFEKALDYAIRKPEKEPTKARE